MYALIFLLIHNIKAENEVTSYENGFCNEDGITDTESLEVCTILGETSSYKYTCNGNDWKVLIFDDGNDCTGEFRVNPSGKSGVCYPYAEHSWIRVNCPNSKSKSTLTTEAIIGITIGILFIVFIIAFIFRKQLFPTRFASQTGEQLLQ